MYSKSLEVPVDPTELGSNDSKINEILSSYEVGGQPITERNLLFAGGVIGGIGNGERGAVEGLNLREEG